MEFTPEELNDMVGWHFDTESTPEKNKENCMKFIKRMSQDLSDLEPYIHNKGFRRCGKCGRYYYFTNCNCFKHPTLGHIRPSDLPAGTPVYIVERGEDNFCVKGMNASGGDFFIAERSSKLKAEAFVEMNGNLTLAPKK